MVWGVGGGGDGGGACEVSCSVQSCSLEYVRWKNFASTSLV